MSRDYSARRNKAASDGKGRSPRSKPAAKPSKSRKAAPARSGTPGFVWLVCGLCIGLTVAAGFYVFARPAGETGREQVAVALPQPAAEASEPEPEPVEPEPAPEAEGEDRFSFYEMLRNYEVVIPADDYPEAGSDDAAAEAPATSAPQVDEPGRYVIQAGSFSTAEDAERRKAELGLLGMSSRIVKVDLASGETRYRVQSETIDSSDRLNRLLRILDENQIDLMVMRAKS